MEVQFSSLTAGWGVDTLIVMASKSKALATSGKATSPSPKVIDFDEATFAEISTLISVPRERALLAINAILIDLYWSIGEIFSHKISASEWVME